MKILSFFFLQNSHLNCQNCIVSKRYIYFNFCKSFQVFSNQFTGLFRRSGPFSSRGVKRILGLRQQYSFAKYSLTPLNSTPYWRNKNNNSTHIRFNVQFLKKWRCILRIIFVHMKIRKRKMLVVSPSQCIFLFRR